MSPLSRMGEFWESPHDYAAAGVPVQGGTGGVVFVRGAGTSYRTAFVECSPPGSFIRGEGATLEEADDTCWAKLQAYLSCPGHEWEPRGYTNGGGFCRHCGQFGSKVFTPEQLGLFCRDCDSPTFHDQDGVPVCKEHDAVWPYVYASIKAIWADDLPEAETMYQRLNAVRRGGDPDPAALEWAQANGLLEGVYDVGDD